LTQKQKIGLKTAIAIVVANMIGTGVFTSLGFQVVDIKSHFALLMLWLIGGLIALAGALSYGELGAAMPRSGGEYHFLGKLYHPLIGFLAGWISILVGFSAPVALAAMAMAKYSAVVLPDVSPVFLSLLIVIIISLVHSFNLRTGSYFQQVVTVLKVLLIIFFIIAGLILARGQEVSLLPVNTDWNQVFSPAFAVSLIYVSYAFSGWNASAYIIDEIKNPEKNLPASLLLGTITVTVLYFLLNFVFIYSSSLAELEGKVEVGFVAAHNIFGAFGGKLMATFISLLLISTISAMVWIGPRVTKVMGEDYPLLRFLSRTNKGEIPVVSIWVQASITCLLIVTATFDQVLIYAGFVLNIFTVLAVVGVFVLRYKNKTKSEKYQVWGYPITPLLFIGLSLWSLLYLLIKERTETSAGLLTILAGVIFYWLNYVYKKRKNKN
jgi:APA family basic amino acid/polyamine antiporter